MSPITFYRPVVPSQSVDIALTFSALHYLHARPQPPEQPLEQPPTQTLSQPNEELQAASAHADLVNFLRLRASEVKPGGTLLANLLTARQDTNNVSNIAVVRKALMGVVQTGLLSPTAVKNMRPAIYTREFEHVEAALVEVGDVWEKVACWCDWVPLPGFEEVRKARESGDVEAHEKASRQWAKVWAGFFVSITGGSLIQAMRVEKFGEEAYNQSSDELPEERALLDQIESKLAEAFFEDARDVELRFDYTFFCLKRKAQIR